MTEDKGVAGRKGGLRKSIQEYYYPQIRYTITTDSLSGEAYQLTLEEAISWGKINSQTGSRAVCYCDATIALPLIAHALAERVPEKRKGPDMSWIFKEVQ